MAAICKSNPALSNKIYNLIKKNVDYDSAEDRKPYTFQSSNTDCQLPSLKLLKENEFAQYSSLVIDTDMMDELVKYKMINWCKEFSHMHALKIPRKLNAAWMSALF